MLGVIDQSGALVEENRPGFIEGNTVLPFVGQCLAFVPLEAKRARADIITTL